MERYLTKTEKIAAFREKYLPVWVILPLISIFVLNCLIYWGSGVLTADRYHFDFTMSLDRAVPLIPHVRPELAGTTWSQQMLKFVYLMDGGNSPSNLFPSIHCYVSWLSWRGVSKSENIPKWYQHFSLIFAILIIISTQVLKQHYLVDAIAGVALVELAWRFYSKGNRHEIFRHFFEKISEARSRWVNKN